MLSNPGVAHSGGDREANSEKKKVAILRQAAVLLLGFVRFGDEDNEDNSKFEFKICI